MRDMRSSGIARVRPQPRVAPPVLAPPGGDETSQILRKLWRRKLLIGTVAGGCLLAGLVASKSMTPRYSAEARLMVGIESPNLANIEAVLKGLAVTSDTLQSESYVIASRAVAQRVVERLKLDEDPEFNPALRQPELLGRLLSPRWWRGTVADLLPEGWVDPPAPPARVGLPAEERAALERQRVVNVFLSKITVVPLSRSRVMSVYAESEDPATAARVANALVAEYIAGQLDYKSGATQTASRWLEQQIEQLRGQVEASDKAVQDYRREHGLYETRQNSLVAEQITELTAQIATAEGARADAQSRLSQASRAHQNPDANDSLPAVLSSPLIQSLRQTEAEMERQEAEMAANFTARHRGLVDLRTQLADVRRKLRAEVGRIVEGLRNEARAADVRYRALNGRLEALKQQYGSANEQSVELRELERRAEADRTLLESLLKRARETDTQLGTQTPDARLVSEASLPGSPSWPPGKLILAVAGLGGLLLGVLLALLLERLDRTFRTREDVEAATGLSTLALVPKVSVRRGATRDIFQEAGSPFGEAVRRLHTRLELGGSGPDPLRTVMFTSAVPDEGKSRIAVAMARLAAYSGRRVVILDCDWRRPVLHRMFRQPMAPGLVDLLTGQADPERVVHRDEVSGLHAIFAGAVGRIQDDAACLRNLPALLRTLARHYDLVVVDTPPILVGTEAAQLAPLVQNVVFVVQWGKTPREVVLGGLRQIVEVGGRLAGVVLSQVDVRRYRRYGEGDAAYAYRNGKAKWVEGDVVASR